MGSAFWMVLLTVAAIYYFITALVVIIWTMKSVNEDPKSKRWKLLPLIGFILVPLAFLLNRKE